MAVRVARFEVAVTPEQWQTRHPLWKATGEAVQQMTNVLWQDWIAWHRTHGSRGTLVAWLAADKASRGKCPVNPLDGVTSEKQLRQEFAAIHGRVVGLTHQAWVGKILKTKAARGSLSGWMAIILGNQSVPSTHRPNPIRFDKANTQIHLPAERGQPYRIAVRLDRDAASGKKNAASTVDELAIKQKHRAGGQIALLHRVACDPSLFKGSQLVYDDRKNKWFAMVCYELSTAEKHADRTRAAVVHAGRRVPLRMKLAGMRRDVWLLGRGDSVREQRRQTLRQRFGRQENYRYTGSSTKGHGRERAMQGVFALGRKWRNFVTHANRAAAAGAVRACQEQNVGRLVFYQPVDARRESRYLTTAGKLPGRTDASGWDWFQLGGALSHACEAAGIEYECRQAGKKLKAKPKAKGKAAAAGRVPVLPAAG